MDRGIMKKTIFELIDIPKNLIVETMNQKSSNKDNFKYTLIETRQYNHTVNSPYEESYIILYCFLISWEEQD